MRIVGVVCAFALFGEAGTDYPFAVMDEDPAGRIDELELAPELAHQLRAGNAERWLGPRRQPSP